MQMESRRCGSALLFCRLKFYTLHSKRTCDTLSADLVRIFRTRLRRMVVSRTGATLLALICFVPAVRAQQGRGTIVGTVTDASGASVKGAKVSILNVDTNNPVNTETNTE